MAGYWSLPPDATVGIEWPGQRQQHTTSVKKNTLSPDWGESFHFAFDEATFDQNAPGSGLKLTVMDWNKLSHHAHIGDISSRLRLTARMRECILLCLPADAECSHEY